MKVLYSLIWGQCSDVIIACVEVSIGFESIVRASDSLKFLGALKQDAVSFQSQKYKQQAKHEEKWWFYHLLQDRSSAEKAFIDRILVVEHCGTHIGTDLQDVTILLCSIGKTRQDASDEDVEEAMRGDKDVYLGTSDLLCVDRHRYVTTQRHRE